ncbi:MULTISPECIES: hypothetical protein [Kordiimonas]|jgi:hypothetical protein|uniref:hypothetical protein n=1 Tax=Kordiimonas TaxID=288021 RepID=UPI00257DEEC5|nr:hypothetical protein [Kordiimonas sp. UBA4487]
MPSLYLPTSPAPVSYRIRSNYRTQSSMAISGKIISRKYGGHYFEITLVYPPMRRDQAAPIIAFLEEQQGQNNIFRVRLPNDMAGTPGLKVGNFANIDAANPSDDNDKLYRITAVDPAVTVAPEALVAGTVAASAPVMRCSLKNAVQLVTLGRSGLIRLEIDLIERVA